MLSGSGSPMLSGSSPAAFEDALMEPELSGAAMTPESLEAFDDAHSPASSNGSPCALAREESRSSATKRFSGTIGAAFGIPPPANRVPLRSPSQEEARQAEAQDDREATKAGPDGNRVSREDLAAQIGNVFLSSRALASADNDSAEAAATGADEEISASLQAEMNILAAELEGAAERTPAPSWNWLGDDSEFAAAAQGEPAVESSTSRGGQSAREHEVLRSEEEGAAATSAQVGGAKNAEEKAAAQGAADNSEERTPAPSWNWLGDDPEFAAAAQGEPAVEPTALGQVSVVVGPIEVRDISKAEELLAALRAVRDGALSEGRVSEYDVYVTNSDGEVCNDKNSNSVSKPAGPYYLREIYPSKVAQDAHGNQSEALAAFRTAKGVLADFKDPNRAVDIPRAAVTEGEVVGEAAFLASVNKLPADQATSSNRSTPRLSSADAFALDRSAKTVIDLEGSTSTVLDSSALNAFDKSTLTVIDRRSSDKAARAGGPQSRGVRVNTKPNHSKTTSLPSGVITSTLAVPLARCTSTQVVPSSSPQQIGLSPEACALDFMTSHTPTFNSLPVTPKTEEPAPRRLAEAQADHEPSLAPDRLGKPILPTVTNSSATTAPQHQLSEVEAQRMKLDDDESAAAVRVADGRNKVAKIPIDLKHEEPCCSGCTVS